MKKRSYQYKLFVILGLVLSSCNSNVSDSTDATGSMDVTDSILPPDPIDPGQSTNCVNHPHLQEKKYISSTPWYPIYPSIGAPSAIRRIWGTSEKDVWIVGERGNIWHFDGNHFSLTQSGTEEGLWSISGGDCDQIWAVGEERTVLHYQVEEGTWKSISSSEFEPYRGHFYTVYATGKNAWVGGDGVLFQYDGKTWKALHSENPILSQGTNVEIVGSGSSDLWVSQKMANNHSQLFHYDGKTWKQISALCDTITCQVQNFTFMGLWVKQPTDVWLIANLSGQAKNEHLFHYNGQVWQEVSSFSGIPLLNQSIPLWSTENNTIITTGKPFPTGSMVVYKDNQEQPLEVSFPTTNSISSLWGINQTLFVGTQNGDIFSYNLQEQTWNQDQAIYGTSDSFQDLFSRNDQDVWVVGHNWKGQGVVYHFDGQIWTKVQTPSISESFISIWGDSTHIWIWGNQGGFLENDGQKWVFQKTSLDTSHIQRMWSLYSDRLWAVTTDGQIFLRKQGGSWMLMTKISGVSFSDIGGYSLVIGQAFWFVGKKYNEATKSWNGYIYKLTQDPTGTTSIETIGNNPILSIWAADSNQIWSLEQNGMNRIGKFWDGSTEQIRFTDSAMIPGQELNPRMFGKTKDDIWLTPFAHWNGSRVDSYPALPTGNTFVRGWVNVDTATHFGIMNDVLIVRGD